MDNDLQKIISEQLEIIPKELKDIIISLEYKNKSQSIADKNGLSADEKARLYFETSLVLLCTEAPSDLVDNLILEGFSEKKAILCAEGVANMIFKDVMPILGELDLMLKPEVEKVNGSVQAVAPISTPTKENILSGIENPEKSSENTISVSSLASNINAPDLEILTTKKPAENEKIEIRKDLLPEVQTGAIIIAPKIAPKEENKITPSLNNLGGVRQTIIMPKERIVMEEKTKLPEKQKPSSGDIYREPIE